jgi:hypothetical protein
MFVMAAVVVVAAVVIAISSFNEEAIAIYEKDVVGVVHVESSEVE